ncbi:MAG: glycosyltransferase involved in cell wall biosynthesis [Maribacter sp.]|jgi:glycosyltransferase involved in cell wall biosynthesis
MSNPLVSVIMPVYNGERYLSEAIESILNQTYENIEFIILDDGSTDASPRILSDFELHDKRIQVHSFKENRGIIDVLNEGITLAKGEYLARMDADDISLPTRLEKQVAFLEYNPDYLLVGCKIELLFGQRQPSGIYPQLYSSSDELRISSLFYCPFSHPTVMMKTNIAKAFGYNSGYHKVEDYELWTRLLQYYFCANLEERLLYYRMHASQETQVRKDILLSNLNRLHQEQFDRYDIQYTREDLAIHLLIPGSNTIPLNLMQLSSINKWLKELHTQLLKKRAFKHQYLDAIFYDTWNSVCKKGKQHGLKTYYLLKRGHFYKKDKKSLFLFYLLSHAAFTPLHRIYLKRKRG